MNELDMIREVNADEPRAETLTTARERLMSAIAEEQPPVGRKHRKVRVAGWTTAGVAAAAAAVIVLVGTTQTPTSPPDAARHTPQPSHVAPPVNAAFVLNQAADHAIHQKDEPIHPGQYRYVSEKTSAIGVAGGPNGSVRFAWREKDIETTWVPYDEKGIWTKDMRQDGPPVVLFDHGSLPAEREMMVSHFPVGRMTARCGDFFGPERNTDPCGREFDDKQLTSAMIATITRDPEKLFKHRNDPAGALQAASMWLRSGLVPGDLRATIYRALALQQGIQVTDNFANLDGRKGVAFGTDSEGYRTDIIIDPETGQYIGFRMVDDGTTGLPKGTVHDSSSVVTGVVDEVGQVPGH